MVEQRETTIESNLQYQPTAQQQQKEWKEVPIFMTAAVTQEFNVDNPLQGLNIVKDFKAPDLKPDEVLVKMIWSSVNPFDYWLNTGKLHLVNPPFITGRDGCGQIVQIGTEAATHFKLHDFVLGATSNWQFGTFGQYAVFKWNNLCLKPEGLSFEHAAALPVVLLTAWECFQKIRDPRSLKRVLIHGGSGGVGSMCILLAKYYFNIPLVITTCRGTNIDYVKELGADEAINYNDCEFDDFILNKYKAANRAPLDLVIDPVGGDVMLEKSYKLLDGNGYYITTVPMKNLDKNSEFREIIGFGINFITQKLKSVISNNPAFYSVLCSYDGNTLSQLVKWMVDQKLQDKFRVIKYPFNEIHTALEQIKSGHTDGKLVIDMSM
jgi:NADPH:quinone reductase-like Zn-dependent oxidoreductase